MVGREGAVGAVMEVADRTLQNMFVGPAGAITIQPVTIHAPAAALAAAALTALPPSRSRSQKAAGDGARGKRHATPIMATSSLQLSF